LFILDAVDSIGQCNTLCFNQGFGGVGVVGQAVDFDGMDSTDPGGTIVTYDWDFGGGTGSGGPTPSQS